MMRACVPVVFAIAFLMLGHAPSAQAQSVQFVKVRDAVPKKFFDASTSNLGVRIPNTLIIGLDTGIDATTFTSNTFSVSNLAFANRMASDTITFEIIAPKGFYVAKVTYQQRGTGSTLRGALERGVAQWVVAGFPSRLGEFSSNANITAIADLTGQKRVSVPVTISLSLFAGPGGSINITDARVIVTLAPLVP